MRPWTSRRRRRRPVALEPEHAQRELVAGPDVVRRDVDVRGLLRACRGRTRAPGDERCVAAWRARAARTPPEPACEEPAVADERDPSTSQRRPIAPEDAASKLASIRRNEVRRSAAMPAASRSASLARAGSVPPRFTRDATSPSPHCGSDRLEDVRIRRISTKRVVVSRHRSHPGIVLDLLVADERERLVLGIVKRQPVHHAPVRWIVRFAKDVARALVDLAPSTEGVAGDIAADQRAMRVVVDEAVHVLDRDRQLESERRAAGRVRGARAPGSSAPKLRKPCILSVIWSCTGGPMTFTLPRRCVRRRRRGLRDGVVGASR